MTVVVPNKVSDHDVSILKEANALETRLLENKAYRGAISMYIIACKDKGIEPTIWKFAERKAYADDDMLKGLNVCDYSVVYDKYIDQLEDRGCAPLLDYYTIAHAKYIFSKLVPSQAKALGWD